MGPDSLYCGKWRKISKSRCDLGLGPAMPNIELVRDTFIYYNILKLHIHRSINFLVIVQKPGNAETQKHGSRETDSDEYSKT